MIEGEVKCAEVIVVAGSVVRCCSGGCVYVAMVVVKVVATDVRWEVSNGSGGVATGAKPQQRGRVSRCTESCSKFMVFGNEHDHYYVSE